jgi:two-component system sensor histidine kinase ChvG
VPDVGGKIAILLTRNAGHVEIAIEDNGPGIVAENIDRIFERFYTDRPEEEGFGQNSGLGLSISRQIIEAHRGTLTVSNLTPPRTGARFLVRLPQI